MLALNYRDSQPLYRQIQDGLRKLIASGALSPGEELPSVLAMSMNLAINPNAIQRAYDELEAEGVICSFPDASRGPSVGLGPDAGHGPDAGKREELLEQLHELLSQLRALDVSTADLIAVMKEVDGE